MRDTTLSSGSHRWKQISELIESRKPDELFVHLKADLASALNDADRAMVYENIGNFYQMLDMSKEAIAAFEITIRLHGSSSNPSLTRVYCSLGMEYRSIGEDERALKAYEAGINKLLDRALKIISEDEDNDLMSGEYADGEHTLNVSPQVFERIRDLCRLDVTFAALRNNMGTCYAELGDTAKARQMFLEAIEFTPQGFRYDHPRSNLAELDRILGATVRTNVLDQFGKIAGSVSEQPDGRYRISAEENHDFATALMSMFIAFADMLSPIERITFSKWAGLRFPEWTQQHRELFALAVLHYIQQTDLPRQPVPDVVRSARRHLANRSLPPLPHSLTPEITDLLGRHFEG